MSLHGIEQFKENLDVVTCSGTWDDFFGAAEYCDNPAWILYDILNNDIYLDKCTLYNMAVYCDTQVDDFKKSELCYRLLYSKHGIGKWGKVEKLKEE